MYSPNYRDINRMVSQVAQILSPLSARNPQEPLGAPNDQSWWERLTVSLADEQAGEIP